MSHPGETVFIPPPGGQTKTLIMKQPGTVAMLMTPKGKADMATAPMTFADEHAALKWCVRHRVNFYCVCPADPETN